MVKYQGFNMQQEVFSVLKYSNSMLLHRPYDKMSTGFSDWAFMSTHCWDEDPCGYWVLRIENNGDSTNRGTRTSAVIFKLTKTKLLEFKVSTSITQRVS